MTIKQMEKIYKISNKVIKMMIIADKTIKMM
jgi:hypothetical protein